jgi:hypothetical protein
MDAAPNMKNEEERETFDERGTAWEAFHTEEKIS